MWKGTAPSLKARPATTKTTPKISTSLLMRPVAICSKTFGISSVPVAPYIIDRPYSRKPLASAPSTKYFIAASVDTAWSRRSAVSAYSDRLISSRPR
jgi:hypothetical protein